MERGDASGSVASVDTAQANKPKRVRTGCLTCRERHLKCDEALPNCQNCRKSSRICKRGIKLNFIDVTCRDPPVLLRSKEWEVTFQDNSREIASEYKGGLARYGISDAPHAPAMDPTMTYDFAPAPSHAPIHAPQPVPAIEGIGPDQYRDEPHQTSYSTRRDSYHHHTGSHSDSGYGSSYMPVTSSSSYANTEPPQTPAKEAKRLLTSRDEVLYIQIFVEEVGLWMDSMDPNKHFSRILPFNSLGEPMLLNAFLACGARHLSLVNPKHSEDNALKYYDTAASLLLNAIPDPNRDTVICAITAVVLNVYEIMSEKALQRMNHIAGARALLKECHWDARSTGVGAACFWLNVGMELLSCLHFNWQVGWDPDSWGLNMDFTRDVEPAGEEVWTYRIMYVVAKIANFRAAATFKGKTQEGSPRSEDHQRQVRYAEWRDLKDLADRWNDSVPRSMQPLAYLDPSQTQSGSNFPEVYVIKRTSIVARLFYHTAMVLLAQVNPLGSNVYDDMRHMEAHHSNIICGIVAHTKDRGVASVALRSLAIAAECLQSRREQEEVLTIFARIQKETGWRVDYVHKHLPLKWGWVDASPPNTGTSSTHSQASSAAPQNPYLLGNVSSYAAPASHNQIPQYSQGASSSSQQHQALGNIATTAQNAQHLGLGQQQSAPSGLQHYQQQRPPSAHPQQAYQASGLPNVSIQHPHHQHQSQSLHHSSTMSHPPQHHQAPVVSHPHAHSFSQAPPQQTHIQPPPQQQMQHQQQHNTPQRRATAPQMSGGMPNPLLPTAADFALPGHSYQNYYVTPNVSSVQGHTGVPSSIGGGGLGFGF